MAVETGEDGKLHYTNRNKFKKTDDYTGYWDWYDNGPGSESFKRKLRKSMGPPLKTFPNLKGFPFHQPFEKPEKSKEYITDKDLEIDI